MRRVVILVLMIICTGYFSGCAAFYGNEKQHKEGDWYWFAGSAEVARIKQDKLAFEKLEAQPVQTAQITKTEGKEYINVELLSRSTKTKCSKRRTVSAGYKGLVVNLSERRRYNFVIKGPETKSYYLGPGERKVDYLIPGTYFYTISRGGYEVSANQFHVNVQQHTFLNEQYHWYVGAEW